MKDIYSVALELIIMFIKRNNTKVKRQPQNGTSYLTWIKLTKKRCNQNMQKKLQISKEN